MSTDLFEYGKRIERLLASSARETDAMTLTLLELQDRLSKTSGLVAGLRAEIAELNAEVQRLKGQ